MAVANENYQSLCAHNLKELVQLADSSIRAWEAAKSQLSDGRLLLWLKTIGYEHEVSEWTAKLGKGISDADCRLEAFLHFLDQELSYPEPDVNPREIQVDVVQGETARVSFVLANRGRGCLSADIEESVSWIRCAKPKIMLPFRNKTQTITVNINTEDLSLGSHKGYVIIHNNGLLEIRLPFTVKVKFSPARVADFIGDGIVKFSEFVSQAGRFFMRYHWFTVPINAFISTTLIGTPFEFYFYISSLLFGLQLLWYVLLIFGS